MRSTQAMNVTKFVVRTLQLKARIIVSNRHYYTRLLFKARSEPT